MTDRVGQVRNVSAKPFNGNNGPITLYSFQLEGDRTYYRTGTDAPNFADGQTIQFDVTEKNGNFNVVKGTVQPAQGVVVQAPKPGTSGTPQSSGSGTPSAPTFVSARDKYWEDKDAHDKLVVAPRINYSASQRDAIALVSAALANDCIALGAAKGKRLDILLGMVDELTERFVAQREASAKEAT